MPLMYSTEYMPVKAYTMRVPGGGPERTEDDECRSYFVSGKSVTRT
jgi:hypothetical protein